MSLEFLHRRSDFANLIRIVAEEREIVPALVEKDYWIMHGLFGLQLLGLSLPLKGGNSLSKGFGLIHRFSEDIDIRIEPPAKPPVQTGRNQNKPAHVDSRKAFHDRLAATIAIDGIVAVERDTAFDDERYYRSGGVRLTYPAIGGSVAGLKDGILLEVGFDDVAPNTARDIPSWAYDHAASRAEVIDNRAIAVPCYHPEYTLIEKLQAIATKFRHQQTTGEFPPNFMRHYTDLEDPPSNSEIYASIGRRICTLPCRARLTPARLAVAGMSLTDFKACEGGTWRSRASELFGLYSALRTSVASISIALR